jgi:molecular chaperone DnaK
VHAEIEPDLAVALGAAVQGGLIAGVDVGPVLVDITPHTLGIETLGVRDGLMLPHTFSPIIERNTPLPATRTEIYSTVSDGQPEAEIRVFQGEEENVRFNTLVGEFNIQGLSDVPSPNEILVRLDLDLNGILRVTATERSTGLVKQVVIDNMMERFRRRERANAVERLDELFASSEHAHRDEADEDEFAELDEDMQAEAENLDPELRAAIDAATAQIAKANQVEASASKEDKAELQGFVRDLQTAIESRSLEQIRRVSVELEDLLFYLSDT